MPPDNDSDDLFDFDEVLNLEGKYYKEGYDEGYKDGAEAGLIEGRSVGLKKGFEKFLEVGRLQGRAIVWANRIPNLKKELENEAASSNNPQQDTPQDNEEVEEEGKDKEVEEISSSNPTDEKNSDQIQLPPLNSNPRLEKNIRMLYGMLEPGTLSTNNDDESVNDVDSRLKGAQARFKIIERAIREAAEKGSTEKRRRPAQPNKPVQGNDNIEDIGKIPQRGGSAVGKGI